MSQNISSDFREAEAAATASPAADASLPAEAEAAVDALLRPLEDLARQLEGQPENLLQLLRRLEQLHRSIQDGPFRSSLPADRNALFQLLSEMERSGGWPYIPRLQLRTFLDLLGATTPLDAAAGGVSSGVAEATVLPDLDRPSQADASRLAA